MKQAERIQIPGINPKLAEELSRHAIHLNRLESEVLAASTSTPGGVSVYVQMTPPTGSGYVWFQTDSGGSVIDILVG